MTYINILIERQEPFATITIDRPKVLNALSHETRAELARAIEELGAEPAIRAVIVTGSGQKAFSSGADIAELEALETGQEGFEHSRRSHELLFKLHALSKPVIMAVNGYALGGGCELALAGDIILASENAQFGLPEVGLGIIPGFGGTQRLPRLIGRTRALEIILTGRRLRANEALEMGSGEPGGATRRAYVNRAGDGADHCREGATGSSAGQTGAVPGPGNESSGRQRGGDDLLWAGRGNGGSARRHQRVSGEAHTRMAGEMTVRAVILSIGSELMRGDIVDTNAAFLSRELSMLGFEVCRVGAYPDQLEELTEAVSDALRDADVTVCTGGLGPTLDDLTRDAIAAALGEDLYFDEALYDDIEQRFALLRRKMPESNRRQAALIPSAKAIPNANGTAPGWFVTHEGGVIVAMPGPPKEMQPMWGDLVLPQLQALLPGHLAMVSLMTFGLGESAVEERIAEVIAGHPDVTVATYAKDAGVQVHISARADTAIAAEELAQQAESRVRALLGEAIFGFAEDTLSSVVGQALLDLHATLAVMESASGGDLASLITNNPGSSEYFVGGIVAYTRDAKCAFGVDPEIMEQHGLISPQTALSMAAAVRARLRADVGLAVTGIAGGDTVEGHAPGTCFVALDLPGSQEVREIHRPASREVAKRFFAQSALDLLRRHASSIEGTGT